MKEIVLREIQKYGRGTSLRMVPRIFTNSGIARVAWLLTFFVCLAILGWHITMIFKNYLSFSVSSVFEEASYGRPAFPDITVCNKDAIVYSGAFRPTWDDYINMTSSAKKMLPYSVAAEKLTSLTQQDYEYIWSTIQSPTGYLSSLPNSEIYSKPTGGSLVMRYSYEDWDGLINTVKTSSSPAWSTDSSVCYTLKVSETDISKIRSLQMVIYVNSLPEFLLSHLKSDPDSLDNLDTTGARVIVHASGTKPNYETGLDVAAGARTILHISNTHHIQQAWPYGNCTKQKYLDAQSSGDQTATETYSKRACYETCLQRSVIEQCGCASGSLQATQRQQDSVNGIVCGNMSRVYGATNIDGFTQLACLRSTNLPVDQCESQCTDPCVEDQYDLVISSTPWPQVATQLSFYTMYVAPVQESLMQGERFQVYQSLINSNSSYEQLIRNLQEIHLLEDNFVNLKIKFDKSFPTVLTETPLVPPETLLAQIGGTLAVWIAMSVDNVVEWFALIAAIVYARFKLQDRKKSLIQDNRGSAIEVGSIESNESGNYSSSPAARRHSTSA